MAELISGDSTQEVAGMPLDNAAASRRRQRSLRLAVVTSLLSKGANVLIMFMALPMAYHLLGKERAAVYGVIQSVMWLVALSDLGIGPGISRRVAECAAMADRAGMKRVISTGLVMIMGLTGVFVGISCVTLSVVPVTAIFGENYAPHAAEMTQAAWLGLFCFAALVILYQLERIREGLQEVHVTNFFGVALNLSAALLLYFGFPRWPGVSFLILALYGLQVIFLSANVLLLMRRKWLRPAAGSFDSGLARQMMGEGFLLFVAGSVSPTILREAPRYMLGRYDSAAAAADSMVLIQLGLLGFGMVTMFARPLYPAFSDAATRLDTEWLQAARRKVNLWALPVALVIIGSLAVLGPWFIRHWIPDNPHVFSWQECGLYGITFTALIWTHVHYVMMAGTNKAGPIAVTGVMEAGLAIVLITSGIQKFGLDGALASCAVASVLTSVWMLPVSVRRHFRELESRRTAGSGNPGALATP